MYNPNPLSPKRKKFRHLSPTLKEVNKKLILRDMSPSADIKRGNPNVFGSGYALEFDNA